MKYHIVQDQTLELLFWRSEVIEHIKIYIKSVTRSEFRLRQIETRTRLVLDVWRVCVRGHIAMDLCVRDIVWMLLITNWLISVSSGDPSNRVRGV